MRREGAVATPQQPLTTRDVAFEACAPGLQGPVWKEFDGPAFVVQLDPNGSVLYRIGLKLGASVGVVASDPRTGQVLVKTRPSGTRSPRTTGSGNSKATSSA